MFSFRNKTSVLRSLGTLARQTHTYPFPKLYLQPPKKVFVKANIYKAKKEKKNQKTEKKKEEKYEKE